MGKIDKTSTSRHLASQSPAISKFIQTFGALSLRELPRHLDSFPRIWPFPRGDLYHWIPVLNRFDTILDTFIREYGLDQGPQTKPFGTIIQEPVDPPIDPMNTSESPTEDATSDVDDRRLIISILNFTRLLLDTCSNRILYASKEHISRLFYSTDLTVVVAAMKVGLQIARRYRDLRTKSQHSFISFGLDIDNIYRLALPFSRSSSSGSDYTADNDSIVHSSNLLAVINGINSENAHLQDWAHIHITTRDKHRAATLDSTKGCTSHTPPVSPSPANRRQPSELGQHATASFAESSGHSGTRNHIHIPMSEIKSTTACDLIQEYIHLIPKESQFDFLHRVNLAKAVLGSRADREAVISVRLLAIAILAYAERESSFVHRLGQPDSVEPRIYQICFQLCSLLQGTNPPDNGVSLELQTTAMNTMEALCFQRSKCQDLCNALMVSQSHGPLFITLRNVINQLAAGTGQLRPEDVEAEKWRDSFLLLLAEIPTLPSTHPAEHLVNAGIIPPLIEILNLRTVEALRSQPRIFIFFDNLMYVTRDAFSPFADAKGLEAIAGLAKYCVDTSLEMVNAGQGLNEEYASSLTEFKIPYFHQQVIKWLLKFTIHRMTANDVTDARYLRNLMDIPALLHTLRTIISNGKIFGAMMWSWAASVLHVFINNEPTSYSVVAEAGLSKGLVESLVCRQLTGSDVSWQHEPGSSGDVDSDYSKPSLAMGWISGLEKPTVRLGREITADFPPAQGILLSTDVMATIPDVLSTFCLNEGGLKMIRRSNVILTFFELFESLEHVRCLDGSPTNAAGIGRSLDHFSRHHPSLQDQIFDAFHTAVFNLNQLLLDEVLISQRGTRLALMGSDGNPTIAQGRLGLLGSVGIARIKRLLEHFPENQEIPCLQDIKKHLSDMIDPDLPLESSSPIPSNQDEGNNLVFATSLFRGVIGFFTRPDNSATYLKKYGIDDFLDLVLHPAFGPSFNYRLRDQISILDNKPTRIIKAMAFHKPHLVIPSILERLDQQASDLKAFLTHASPEPFFQPFITEQVESADATTQAHLSYGSSYVKALQNTYTLGMSLSTLFQDIISNRQMSAPVSNLNVTEEYVRMIEFLMMLQSASLWEEITLHPADSTRWVKLCRMLPGDWIFAAPRILGLVEYQGLDGWKELSSKLLAWQDSDEAAFGSESSIRFQNYSVIRYLLTNVTAVITPLLRSLLRMVHQGRNIFDSVHMTRLFPLIGAMSSGFKSQLKFAEVMRESQPDAYCPYLAVILHSLYLVLFDEIHSEGNSVKYIRVLMTARLKDEGVFDMLLDILQDLVQSIPSSKQEGDDDTNARDHPVEYSIQNILLICHQAAGWTSPPALFEPSSDVEFNSYRYYLELRTMVLEVCLKLWNKDVLERFSLETTRIFMGLVKMLFEVKPDDSLFSLSAIKDCRLSAPPMSYIRNPSRLGPLAEKFGEDLALEALYRCHDDAQAAEEYCAFIEAGFAVRMPIPEEHLKEYEATDSRPSGHSSSSKNAPCVIPPTPEFSLNNKSTFADSPTALIQRYNSLKLNMRDSVTESVSYLLNSHNTIEHDLSQLMFVLASAKKQDDDFPSVLIDSLIKALISLKVEDVSACTPEHAKKVSTAAHLLGLVLRDSSLFEISMDKLKGHFDDLVSFISVMPAREGEEPVFWIAQILLVMEALLTYDAIPLKVTSPTTVYSGSEYGIVKRTPLPEFVPFLSDVQKLSLLDSILAVLPKLSKDELTNLGVVRVLSFLSRKPKFAAVLGEKHNIRKLFLLVRQLNGAHNEQFKVVFLLILRHIMEDEQTIRDIIKADLIEAFHGADPPSFKTTDMVNTRMPSMLRSPDIFVDVASELFTFLKFDGPNSTILTLRSLFFNQDTEEMKMVREKLGEELGSDIQSSDGEDPASNKPSEPKTPALTKQDGVVHYLLCELLAYKDVKESSHKDKPDTESQSKENESPDTTSASATADKPPAPSENKPEEFTPAEHSVYLYRCFLLQCLTELLLSYNKAKAEFIHFSRKTEQNSVTPSKHHSRVLSYLLNTLIPVGTITHSTDFETRKRVALSGWATQVIVALCSKTGEVPLVREKGVVKVDESVEPELTHVRRIVLDQILRSFKEAQSSGDSLDHTYSRLLGLGDLVNRLLTKQFSPGSTLGFNVLFHQHNQVVKLMYEKNFAAVLAGATTDIDLSFPNARRAVKYLLRPLKHLSQLSMQLAMDAKLTVPPNSHDDDALSSSDVSDVSDMREETPDLYRNSTLGVLEPGDDDDPGSDDMEDDDEQMYDEEYDDEMEYDDEPHDEDEVMSEDEGEMGPIEGLPGDVPISMELVMNGHDDGSSDDMSHDDSDTESDESSEDDELDHDLDDSGHELEDELEDELEFTAVSLASGDNIGADDEDWVDEDEFEGTGLDDDEDEFGHIHDLPHSHSLSNVMYIPSERDLSAGLLPTSLDQILGDENEDDEQDEEPFDEEGYDQPHDHSNDLLHLDFDSFRRGIPPVDSFHYYSRRPASHPHSRLGPDGSVVFHSRPLDDSLSRHDTLNHPLAPNPTPNAGMMSLSRLGLQPPSGIGPDARVRVEGFGTDFSGVPTTVVNYIINILRNVPLFQPGGYGNGSSQMPNLSANSFQLSLGPGLLTGDPNQAVEISYPLNRQDPEHAVNFSPARTLSRWEEEYKLIFLGKGREKAVNVFNRFLVEIIPFSVKHRFVLEQIRNTLREQEEARVMAEAERIVADTQASLGDVPAAVPGSALAGQTDETANNEVDAEDEGTEDEDVEHEDEDDDEDDDEGASRGSDEADNEQEPEEPAERASVTIRGRSIDITGMGMDLEYLLALPEDIREEVVMQELAQRRPRAAPVAAAAPPELSSIDPDFLSALPASIRAEVLEQEAQDRRRREREEERRRQLAAGGADPAAQTPTSQALESAGLFNTFPHLRHLMISGSDLLSPGSTALDDLHSVMVPLRHAATQLADREARQKKPRVLPQLLDKSGVASMLRFMFIPMQGSARQSLDEILRHICLARPTRSEVLTNLLTILQDGSIDIGSMDHSFSQLSLRAKSQPGSRSPHPSKRVSISHDAPNLDVSPLMVIQQCLRTLAFLTKDNNRLCMFFLTEHESGGIRVRSTRKGKHLESKGNKFPINALLSLLESPIIMESSPVIEQLASLLQYITIPLGMLFKRDKESQDKPADVTEADVAMTDVPPAESDPPAPEPSKPAEEGASTEVSKSPAKDTPLPEIPEHNLRLVVNIIVTGECGPRAFRDTLSLVTNLSSIPEAKEIFGSELLSHSIELGNIVLADLVDLSGQIDKANSGTELHGVALARFTPATADQAKLLRIFLSLDYLFDPRRSERHAKSSSGSDTRDKDHILMSIYENPIFGSIWDKLGECLTKIRIKEMLNVANVLLPLIEVLMVVCKNTTLKDAPLGRAESRDDGTSTPVARPGANLETLFFTFTEEHRKVLNDLVRSNPKLMSGSFSLMVKNCKVLEFDNKRNFFSRALHKRGSLPTHAPATLNVNVRRDQVFLDSFKSLNFKSAEDFKYSKLNIQFTGEAGVDAGGVTREWFQVLSKQMFNPDYALFTHASADSTIFHPNVHSGVNREHLMYFRFIGRIIGKAIYEGRLLDCHFSRAVYKRLLGKSVALSDLESLDLDYYKSLVWMLENDITDVITETFSTTSDQFGVMVETDLIENGRNIAVTEENKSEYVRLLVEYKLVGAVKEQLDAFLKGFHDIIPPELVSIFSEQELELLISGLPDIDVDDWKNNSSYQNYTASSPQIQWFWRAIRSFDKEERAKLLQFVTGTSKVPLNGFKELEGMSGFSKFTIHRDYGSTDRLPSAHTCFNQLDLPEYESYEKLRQQLYTAFTAGNEYFAFA